MLLQALIHGVIPTMQRRSVSFAAFKMLGFIYAPVSFIAAVILGKTSY